MVTKEIPGVTDQEMITKKIQGVTDLGMVTREIPEVTDTGQTQETEKIDQGRIETDHLKINIKNHEAGTDKKGLDIETPQTGVLAGRGEDQMVVTRLHVESNRMIV